MKVVVTGCAGFIGSHLSRWLVSQGYEVYGIDAFTDFYAPSRKQRNIQSIAEKPNFHLFREDLISCDLVQILDGASIIYHLAAQPGVRTSWGSEFAAYTTNNIVVTQRVLEYAKGLRSLIKFVYASSSSVYGRVREDRVAETHATAPYSPYGVTKLAGELLCSVFAENYAIPMASLRFFTVYGPSQRPDMAFARIIEAALKRETFAIYGDGFQERDFTYVEDIVQGLIRVGSHPEGLGVFNIGGGKVTTLKEVVGLVEEICEMEVKIQYEPSQRGDVRRTSADISKIRKVVGFSPGHDLREGLSLQIEHARNFPDGI